MIADLLIPPTIISTTAVVINGPDGGFAMICEMVKVPAVTPSITTPISSTRPPAVVTISACEAAIRDDRLPVRCAISRYDRIPVSSQKITSRIRLSAQTRPEHGAGEGDQRAAVPAEPLVPVREVPPGIEQHQGADPGDDQRHDHRQGVEAQVDGQRQRRNPLQAGRSRPAVEDRRELGQRPDGGRHPAAGPGRSDRCGSAPCRSPARPARPGSTRPGTPARARKRRSARSSGRPRGRRPSSVDRRDPGRCGRARFADEAAEPDGRAHESPGM